MNRIFSFKNLTKKISLFFLVFFILIFSSIKIASAEILLFGFGTDITTCKSIPTDCKVNSSLIKSSVGNPNYKLVNTTKSLDRTSLPTEYQVTDFNISLDDFIKERLYRGNAGYFGNSIDKNFTYFDNDFNSSTSSLSTADQKNLALLSVTMGSNVETQDGRLEVAKNVIKSLANTTDSSFDYEDSQVAVLTYYYLKIYKVLDQYLIINKAVLSADAQKQLADLEDNLRKNIYTYLYKTGSIVKADGCTTDGSNLDKCDLFVSGKFKIDANGSAPDLEFNVTPDVNNLKLDASKYDTNANTVKIDTTITNADPNTRNNYSNEGPCPANVSLSSFVSGAIPIVGTTLPSSCSVGAYLINIVIQGINALVNIFVDLASSLFTWIYNTGVINFKDWVDGSGAYTIYKTIILSLLVSVMVFFVSYLIIKRLLTDDGESMNKVLPRLILTALFVYFSFTITGWIIDQSNIITIYLYRSMTHQDGSLQTIGEVFKRVLNLDNGGANSGGTGISGNFGISLGSWNAIPFTAGQLIVSIVGVFVLFEGAILILSRTIILLLCMIFSPIMLIPEGLTDFTDKYRKLVIDNFTGNVLLGPVFMFLVLLAVQIGQITTKMVGSGPNISSTGGTVPTNFLGGIISSVLVIAVLQLAISASKGLSGSVGEKLSGVISKYAGGAAFGGGAKVLRNTLGRGAAVAKDRGWMMGEEGSRRHKFMTGLYNGVSKSTFDARNTDTFKQAANFSGAGANSFGAGSNRNYDDSFKRKLYDANKYHSGLDEVGKTRNIARLKSSASLDNRRIAESLEKKWKPSINERLNNDSGYNQRFDKAATEKDTTKRKIETEKIINEHFKENGLGGEHFSREINKPENNKIKQEYEKALSEQDPVKRKEVLTKVIVDLDKKSNPDEGSITPKVETKDENKTQSVNTPTKTPDQIIQEEKDRNGGYIPSAKDLNAQSSLKARLKEKFSARERIENGQIIRESSPELLANRKLDLRTSRRNIEKQIEDQYQQSVLDKASTPSPDTKRRTMDGYQILNAKREEFARNKNSLEQKAKINQRGVEEQKEIEQARIQRKIERSNGSDDEGPNTPSPSGSGKPEISNSLSVNETGLVRTMSPEYLATLNKNRDGGDDNKKVA